MDRMPTLSCSTVLGTKPGESNLPCLSSLDVRSAHVCCSRTATGAFSAAEAASSTSSWSENSEARKSEKDQSDHCPLELSVEVVRAASSSGR